jgi:hypothetical protein
MSIYHRLWDKAIQLIQFAAAPGGFTNALRRARSTLAFNV